MISNGSDWDTVSVSLVTVVNTIELNSTKMLLTTLGGRSVLFMLDVKVMMFLVYY